ncbi:MAG TPA: hypothetical protein PKO45_13280 [Rubrivivax sp.]|nr:hypothetical protein [Rubrivivax sp.]
MKGEILGWLATVEAEHARRRQDPALEARVLALKRYQQRRLEWTYRDLLASTRYAEAARFFLVDLYGPVDFRQRDREFARIVPKIEALFPQQTVATVWQLARLHALSEELDSAMANALDTLPIDPGVYASAWRRVGRENDRKRQLELVIQIGAALERMTRHAWLVNTLKWMRGPARAAGLSELQAFLERGLGSFRSMRGATEFLKVIEARESELMNGLFQAAPSALDELPAA